MDFNCVRFLGKKTILITGAPGFLAKVLVEKILRLQPNVKKMYLLLRAQDNHSAMQRLRTEVLEIDLFRVMRNDLGEENLNALVKEKIVPVAGDISMDNLGLKDTELMQRMWSEIDMVINIAATTNFDERYDIGLGINTFGALNVLNFAKKCVRIQLLLHVSTAYVCGEKSGLLTEKPFKMGETLSGDRKLDINLELEIMKQKLKELQNFPKEEISQTMKDLGMARAKLHGWPNTYVFTKAMGEMLIGNQRENLPLVIVRPTMITSTIAEPFPGWIEGLKTLDSVIVAYGKGRLQCFLADRNTVYDLIFEIEGILAVPDILVHIKIPADMVVNAMIVAATAHSGNTGTQTIYQVGSSCKNPVTWGQLHDTAARYFTKSPLVSRNGSPIIVPRGTIFPTMSLFSLYMTLRYKLPLQILRLISVLYPWSQLGDRYIDLSRKINLAMRLVELYLPYLLFKGVFDNSNTEKLRMERKNNIKELDGLLEFDSKSIDWDDYIENTHIPGLITYVLKI